MMNDEEKTEGEEEEKTTEEDTTNNEEEGNSSSRSVVEEAKIAAEQIKKGNRETRELIERGEKLRSESILSGKSMARQPGTKPREKTPEEVSVDFEDGKFSLTG